MSYLLINSVDFFCSKCVNYCLLLSCIYFFFSETALLLSPSSNLYILLASPLLVGIMESQFYIYLGTFYIWYDECNIRRTSAKTQYLERKIVILGKFRLMGKTVGIYVNKMRVQSDFIIYCK